LRLIQQAESFRWQ